MKDETCVFSQFYCRLNSYFLAKSDGGGIFRSRERTACGDDILIHVFEVFRSPFSQNSRSSSHHDLSSVHGGVIDEGAGEIACFKRSGVDKWFEGGAWRALPLRDTVEHAVAEITASDPGDCLSRLVVDEKQ